MPTKLTRPTVAGVVLVPARMNGMKYSLQAAMAMSSPTVRMPGQGQRQHHVEEGPGPRRAVDPRGLLDLDGDVLRSTTRTSRP